MNSLNHLENIIHLELVNRGNKPLTTFDLLKLVTLAIQAEAQQSDDNDRQWRALHDEIDSLGQES